MLKILHYLFPPNDWVPIKVWQAKWTDRGVTTDKAIYEIQYSAHRKTFRLELSGSYPKEHQFYPDVVNMFYQIYHNYVKQASALNDVSEILNNTVTN